MDLQGLEGACTDMHGIALVCVDYASCNVSLDSSNPGVYFLAMVPAVVLIFNSRLALNSVLEITP